MILLLFNLLTRLLTSIYFYLMADATPPTAIYICEETGSDNGQGTSSAPFLTAVAALTAGGPQSSILFRKKASDEYGPLGTSALKKAKKTLEINERKAQKAREAESKASHLDAERAAREAKRLEDSRKIILTEDASLPPATKVRPGEDRPSAAASIVNISFSTLCTHSADENSPVCGLSYEAC